MRAALLLLALAPAPAPPLPVGPGTVRPLYPVAGQKEVAVAAFLLDPVPVTNRRFLAFVERHPAWQRGRAPALFVDAQYLARWAGPLALGTETLPEQPVVQVSWFAARAFCAAAGGRLPTQDEWELAAAASETAFDAREDPLWRARILAWYARPGTAPLPAVGKGPKNRWGVQDLHGVVWEWVEDFSRNLVTGDNREGKGADNMLFCGAGALGASTKIDYASFMRYAMRSSLQARYTTGNLGFRCAYDPRSER